MKRGATGVLLDQFPYARMGCGPRTMVVLPGVDDAMFSGRYPPSAAWALYWYFSRFVDDYTVYVVSRPCGLPEGYAIADMATGTRRCWPTSSVPPTSSASRWAG